MTISVNVLGGHYDSYLVFRSHTGKREHLYETWGQNVQYI